MPAKIGFTGRSARASLAQVKSPKIPFSGNDFFKSLYLPPDRSGAATSPNVGGPDIALKLYVINQPVAVRSGFNGVHAARLPSRRSVNTRGVFATTQAALNEAAYEWGTRLVGGVCYKPVPVAGSSLLANARSAIR